MQKIKIFGCCLLVLFLALAVNIPDACAAERYKISIAELNKHKAIFDDPRPYLTDSLSYKKVLPADVYAKLTYDIEGMKRAWAEVIGFKAPDVVGKIAPEIKPGTYSYKDKGKYPGLKELMIPAHYEMFNPGAPPHAGNFPEIKVVPPRQYYWALPIAEATKKYMGHTKLDNQGYIQNETYIAGYPFPRPEGKFKAQQIVYNWEKRYLKGENIYIIENLLGFNKKLKIDFRGAVQWWELRLHGRVLLEPYGWYDQRAQKMGEAGGIAIKYVAPRDMYGNAFSVQYYVNPDHFDQFLLYVNALRRIRKMTATDSQDAVGGQDMTYEDKDAFAQKISPNRYPFKFELISEREYLVPAPTWDGSLYMTSKGFEYHNIEFERRPLYVISLTQLDNNHVYSKRILYIDKETLMLFYTQCFDQKGRLYRDINLIEAFVPEMGMLLHSDVIARDHIDLHSNRINFYTMPAAWVKRKDINLRGLMARGK